MILAAPPAADMTYVNAKRGLSPSSYAGGGSASSSFRLDPPLESRGSALLVSPTGSWKALDGVDSGGGLLEYAGAATDPDARGSVVVTGSATESWSGAKREEKGGGREEEEASEAGYWGGGDCSASFSVAAVGISPWSCVVLFSSSTPRTMLVAMSNLEDSDVPVAVSCRLDNAAD